MKTTLLFCRSVGWYEESAEATQSPHGDYLSSLSCDDTLPVCGCSLDGHWLGVTVNPLQPSVSHFTQRPTESFIESAEPLLWRQLLAGGKQNDRENSGEGFIKKYIFLNEAASASWFYSLNVFKLPKLFQSVFIRFS